MAKAARKVVTLHAARAILKILQQLGIKCGLQGELACGAYGASRVPKAVEVMLFSPSGVFPYIETLKNTITLKSNGPSHFFLANPTSSSSALCYRDATIPVTKKNTCEVSIVYFHDAPLQLLRDVNDLIVVPLPFLLLRKLQTWTPSRSFTKKGRPRGEAKDIENVLELLDNYRFEGIHFDQKLFELSKDRVREYRSIFPKHGSTWKRLGYEELPSPEAVINTVPPPQPLPPLESDPDVPLVIETSDYLVRSELSRIQMVCLAGKTTVNILKELDCRGVIFGSLACFLYGNHRSPNDVDVLVLPPGGIVISMEDLKSAIVELDPVHFFLISARDPRAGYRILYFRLTDGPGGLTPRTSCKVDVVVPRTMHLPPLPVELINWDEGLPLIPFSLLLLQKLQSWDDHRRSSDELKRLKQHTDVEDLQCLLELSEIKTLQYSPPWSDRRVFSTEFEALSRERVKQYCYLFPDSANGWRDLGFETYDEMNTDTQQTLVW